MNRNDKFELFFSENELISSNKSWKKIGDNYAQFSMFNPSEYKTETTCCIKTN